MKPSFAVVIVTFACAAAATAGTAPARVSGAPTATFAPGAVFMSPSGNIRCRYFPSAATVGCLTVNNGIETMMRATGRPYAQKVSHSFPAGGVLAYGRSRAFAPHFRCTSRKEGMFCRSLVNGRCFLAAREGQQFTCAQRTKPSGETKPSAGSKQNCHPSYEGACLDPNASDYDCAGGSGDGPEYTGTVKVVGPDVFRLDADGDGLGCEP